MFQDNSDIENDFLTISTVKSKDDPPIDDKDNNEPINTTVDNLQMVPVLQRTNNGQSVRFINQADGRPAHFIIQTPQIPLPLPRSQSEQKKPARFNISLPMDGPEASELRRFLEMMDERMSSYARQNFHNPIAQNTVVRVNNNTETSQLRYSAHRHFEQTIGRIRRTDTHELILHGNNYEPSGSVNSSSEYNTSPREIFQNNQISRSDRYAGATVMPSPDFWPGPSHSDNDSDSTPRFLPNLWSRRSYFNLDSYKPHFDFVGIKCIDFDLQNHGLEYIHEQIKMFKGYKFSFDITYRGKQAYGEGATRQVYTKLCNDLVGTIMKKIHPYFMDVNVNHPFWNTPENVECFVMFIGMVIDSDCVLPFHFAPALLESIANKKMNLKHLEFFMEKLYPTEFASVKKVHPNDFYLLDSDYENHEDYYRSKVIGSFDRKKMNIYSSIAKYFELFDSFYDYDILTIDSTLSGKYNITPEMVLTNINFTNFKYQPIWENFVKSLTELELKQMLILFGNTTSLDKHYTIYVSHTLKTDIHITTCMQMVTISENLFEHEEYLNNLKLYFSDFDQISDSPSIFRNYDDDNRFMPTGVTSFWDMEAHSSSHNDDGDRPQMFWRSFRPFVNIQLPPITVRPNIGGEQTLRRPVANLGPFNADFDGDETNINYRELYPSLLLNGRPIYGDIDSIFVRIETPVNPIFSNRQLAISLTSNKIEQKAKDKKNRPRNSRNVMRRSNNIVRNQSRNTSRKFRCNYH
ncbi:hypothetical protein QJ857_gp0109 [Tupanvirus soda lake]|uniref:HECT domain-containing protein n=2 Tax=Tupanvirus TaxID=2094720 RepID=A0A6N1NNH8_9VIRU|nr:hypothetical protein QJ857_gp0109 [Tupanvirus soda lake]QKU35914.1 hypothetical protein [Tupanvirus soda lake]